MIKDLVLLFYIFCYFNFIGILLGIFCWERLGSNAKSYAVEDLEIS